MTMMAPLMRSITHGAPGRRDWRWVLSAAVPVVVLGLVAFAVRAVGVHSGFELWVDEMVYSDLGNSVARGDLPNLPNGYFFLHPPGMFVVEGLVIKVFGLGDLDPASRVWALRWLTITLGALSVMLVFLIVQRIVGRLPAWFAAALMIFEPFVLRNNSRVFLETLGGLFVLVGLLALIHHITAGGARDTRVLLPVTAGAFFGLAILTKDVYVLYVFLPVVAAIFWRKTLAMREALLVLAATVTPYALYLLFLFAAGRLGGWVEAKAQGIARMFGGNVTSGYNAEGAPSLVSRLIELVGHYGTSYALLAICPLAGILVVRSARPERRMVGLTALFMGAFGLYSAAFGTFEEQYGYGIMLASITAMAVAVVEAREQWPRVQRPVLVATSLFLVFAVALGVRTELTTDNGFQQFHEWVAEGNLPADAKVGVTNGTAHWMYARDPRFGVWVSPKEMRDAGAQYILTQSLTTRQGYDYAVPGLIDWLEANATPVFRADGPNNGATILYRVDQPALDEGADADVAASPDRNGGEIGVEAGG
ncbi:ArnT family glycosyltransferase [Actinomycetospora aeridis]|uniref:Phospholipid carrier-dependent glycosyltransferase n=1 Tax=Actinomycetospora aeridis TaxID=3129231 RepID=A0ABU8MYI3_9PSEU